MATKSLEKLIDQFNKLPGVGKKSAIRFAFYILNSSEVEVKQLIDSLKDAKELIKRCESCGDYCEKELCDICSDDQRNNKIICVVAYSRDVISFEKTNKYFGKYHILNGNLDPLNGVTPDKLNIKKLLERIAKNNVEEIILAMNPNLEGETTSLYLAKLLKPFNIRLTKLASGIPMGGNIEFTDSATISKALDGRIEIDI